jgi:uncharacterized protein
MSRNWKFDRRVCRNGKFRAMLKGGNGEIVIPTQQYTQKAALANGITSIMENSQFRDAYVRRVSADGKPYFCLKSMGNHKIIAGPSEMYESAQAMEDSINAMFHNAHHADIVTSIGFFSFKFDTLYGDIPEEN